MMVYWRTPLAVMSFIVSHWVSRPVLNLCSARCSNRSAPHWFQHPPKRSPRTATSLSGWPLNSQGSCCTKLLSPWLPSRLLSTSSSPSPLRHHRHPLCSPCRPSLPIRWQLSAYSCASLGTLRCCWRRGSMRSVCCAWCWASQTMEKEVSLKCSCPQTHPVLHSYSGLPRNMLHSTLGFSPLLFCLL